MRRAATYVAVGAFLWWMWQTWKRMQVVTAAQTAKPKVARVNLGPERDREDRDGGTTAVTDGGRSGPVIYP